MNYASSMINLFLASYSFWLISFVYPPSASSSIEIGRFRLPILFIFNKIILTPKQKIVIWTNQSYNIFKHPLKSIRWKTPQKIQSSMESKENKDSIKKRPPHYLNRYLKSLYILELGYSFRLSSSTCNMLLLIIMAGHFYYFRVLQYHFYHEPA